MKRKRGTSIALAVILAVISLFLMNLAFSNSNLLGTLFSQMKGSQSETASPSEPIVQVTSTGSVDGKELRFAVISDLHVRSTDETAQNKVRKAFEDLMDSQQSPLDLIVVNGDLGDGLPEDYRTLQQIIENVRLKTKSSTPIVFTDGNHEFYKAYHQPQNGAWSPETFPNGDTDEQALGRFLAFAGRDKVFTDRIIKGYSFLFLGSEKSAMSDRAIGDGVYLSSEQLTWLKQKLAANDDPQKPIFLFLHQPVLTVNGDSPIHTQYVMQHDELVKILEAYPQVILFSGHLHLKLGAPGTIVHQKFTLYGDSSVTRVRGAAPEASEGLFVRADGSQVTVQGRDFLHHSLMEEVNDTLNFSK